VLDRAMILQQLDRYDLASRDLEAADKQVEILDLSRSSADEIGRYLFSDEVGPYKAPPYEKLMINTMNMVNYLARGNLSGARVEARRLAVMQRFIREREDPGAHLNGPGSYLAGFTFEHSGEPQQALRYYDEALQYGDYASLYDPIRRLAARASYRTPRIRAIVGEREPEATPTKQPAPAAAGEVERPKEAQQAPPSAADGLVSGRRPPAGLADDDGEILVVISFGRVPAKVAKRIPIGLALTYASGFMSHHDRARANYLAAQGLVTWINYPELGRPRGEYEVPGFAIDGRWMPLEGVLAVDRAARRAWEEAKGAVVASAITRLLSRIVAGEAIRRGSGGGLVGALLSLGTQATLTAADTPDTRSWSTLPARIAFGRARVRSGTHWVWLGARGTAKRQRVVVRPRGYAVVNFTVLG
jgi:hypothetical protein